MNQFNHLFGPVPSRRFGRSLGVDLTPYKTCTLDCIYCQLGATTRKTLERKSWVDLNAVEAELHFWMRAGGQADYITLSGSGEPTLHAAFGRVLEFIRTHSRIPAVLLTNGTLMSRPEVRTSACKADIVKATLGAWNQSLFQRIHRPQKQIAFREMVDGLKQFRTEYNGRLWLEVFLLAGVNDALEDAGKIADLARRLKPDQIHLNTVVRPPATAAARPVPRGTLERMAPLFTPKAKVIADFSTETPAQFQCNETHILNMLRRRPCTAAQIATAFDMHPNEIAKYTGRLIRLGKIKPVCGDQEIFFHILGSRNVAT